MAGISSISATHFLFLSLFLFSSAVISAAPEDDSFVTTDLEEEDKMRLLGLKKEKLTHIRVYWHDVLAGKHPTVVQIAAPASNASTTSFGLVRVIDDPLTAGPDRRSKLWGRAQGLYAAASQENLSLLIAMNFAFISGKYNGSSITILGRNPVSETVREVPVIGGSGAFRFARGYARLRTVAFNSKAAVVEYNVSVLHY